MSREIVVTCSWHLDVPAKWESMTDDEKSLYVFETLGAYFCEVAEKNGNLEEVIDCGFDSYQEVQ